MISTSAARRTGHWKPGPARATRERGCRDAAPPCVAVFLAVLAIAATCSRPAVASEQSQALSARGLIELDAGRTEAALALFDQAVQADPGDAVARYQRGAARAKLGNYQSAVDDLRAALALQPELPHAQLELGVALTELRQYREAEPYLLLAQRWPDLDGDASFFLGIAQLRLERYDDAARNFARAAARDPSLAPAVQYYQAVIAYRRRDYETAASGFAEVAAANPDTAIGREATQFLASLQRARRAAYSAFGTLAFEYDTNVTLAPDTATGVTGQADGRFVINLGGTYVPFTHGPVSLGVSYEFFQSLQFELTDFNLQDHRPAVQLMVDLDPVVFGVLGRYDYYLLGGNSFLQEGTAFPWITLREEGIGRTEMYLRVQRRDYKLHTLGGEPAAPGVSNIGFTALDGIYSFAGVRQVLNLWGPNRQLWFGYQLGFTTPVDSGSEAFQYTSNQLEIALRWTLPYAVIGEAAFRWEHQGYAPESGVFPPTTTPPSINGPNRVDNDYRAVVSFERALAELSEHLFVVASWFGTFNDSNKTDFQYDRQIGSIAAEVRF